jgi:hypothetical protein
MNRILKRPMFRMGGAAEGITSGLDKPRQQYNRAGMVKNQFEAEDNLKTILQTIQSQTCFKQQEIQQQVV